MHCKGTEDRPLKEDPWSSFGAFISTLVQLLTFCMLYKLFGNKLVCQSSIGICSVYLTVAVVYQCIFCCKSKEVHNALMRKHLYAISSTELTDWPCIARTLIAGLCFHFFPLDVLVDTCFFSILYVQFYFLY